MPLEYTAEEAQQLIVWATSVAPYIDDLEEEIRKTLRQYRLTALERERLTQVILREAGGAA